MTTKQQQQAARKVPLWSHADPESRPEVFGMLFPEPAVYTAVETASGDSNSHSPSPHPSHPDRPVPKWQRDMRKQKKRSKNVRIPSSDCGIHIAERICRETNILITRTRWGKINP